MTDKELLYIKTIIEEKSITKASIKLYIAQPSLSQAVHKIESQLGKDLFIRTPNGLKPTSYGMQYYETANKILRTYDKMLSRIGNIAGQHEQLHFGTSTDLGSSLIGKIYPYFLQEHPDIKISIYENSYSNIYKKIRNGYLDLAVLHIPLEEMANDLCYKFIQKDDFIVISNPDLDPFISAHYEEGYSYPVINPEELQRHSYIKLENTSSYHSFLERHFKNNKINLNDNILLTANRSHTANQIACVTEGFSLCPNFCVSDTIPDRCRYQLPSGYLPDYDIYALTTDPCHSESTEMTFINFFQLKLSQTFDNTSSLNFVQSGLL